MGIIISIGMNLIWLTPIVFVTSLIGAIKAIKEERKTTPYTITCSISFMLIVVSLFFSN
ncbi:hypothetical protein SAMN03080606_03915 [Alkaliphilus peptidifermentans DSM 18978]|uniref:Uncharacterized protein n=1 Tax=Alkaliphilus peptidifermentans DSM 18978 TaxID=1120976 RepID=A0A1G5L0S6_9FIRM|nr:hypothetical protein SAMN03080606_03915 [Alkaliphilus peptidifermentans DSM 18978]